MRHLLEASGRNLPGRITFATVLMAVACACAGDARAFENGPALSASDSEFEPQMFTTANAQPMRQVWAISSRQAGGYFDGSPRLLYWRHDDALGWTPSSQEEFLAADQPGVVTCFYVHGNRVDHQQALANGWRAYQQLIASSPADQPLRFVIWSWPSTEVGGPLVDVRLKACVSDLHAWHLAWLIDQMHPDVPIRLIGYSFGARLISGSLHLLGGGTLAGHVMNERMHPTREPVRVVLMAGALDGHALLPNGCYARALSQVQRMLVTVNCKDPVLHHYPLLGGLLSKGPPALGYTGFFSTSLGEDYYKVAQWNVSSYVGKDHAWQKYLYSPAIVSRLSSYVLGPD